jgi:hypothetical protein
MNVLRRLFAPDQASEARRDSLFAGVARQVRHDQQPQYEDLIAAWMYARVDSARFDADRGSLNVVGAGLNVHVATTNAEGASQIVAMSLMEHTFVTAFVHEGRAILHFISQTWDYTLASEAVLVSS